MEQQWKEFYYKLMTDCKSLIECPNDKKGKRVIACEYCRFEHLRKEVIKNGGIKVCESLEGFLRHCYLNKHIVSNEKLEDIIFRLVDCFNDDKSRIECIERAVRGGYFDIKA